MNTECCCLESSSNTRIFFGEKICKFWTVIYFFSRWLPEYTYMNVHIYMHALLKLNWMNYLVLFHPPSLVSRLAPWGPLNAIKNTSLFFWGQYFKIPQKSFILRSTQNAPLKNWGFFSQSQDLNSQIYIAEHTNIVVSDSVNCLPVIKSVMFYAEK